MPRSISRTRWLHSRLEHAWKWESRYRTRIGHEPYVEVSGRKGLGVKPTTSSTSSSKLRSRKWWTAIRRRIRMNSAQWRNKSRWVRCDISC